MNKAVIIIFFLYNFSLCAFAQDYRVLGKWKTVDDTDGRTKSIVELYMKEGKLFAKVVELLPAATTTICNSCPGDKAGKSLIQMDIVWNMRPSGTEWSGGQIVDPKNGKVYSCLISLEKEDLLKVRGYIGLSLLGRTQLWHKVKS
ncbi:MAG: DUF2147 domain-containing protein [Saprospiraceae bacterium]|nr:DUF2147 domain-containing protein [Saprospiraceae bacterium]